MTQPPDTPPFACIGECMMEIKEHADGTLTRSFGGDTLNTALYLRRLGVPVDYVTALGDDPFSDQMVAAWQAEGIGTGLIPRLPGRLPGLYLIQTDPAGERRFFYWRSAAPARQLLLLDQAAAIEAALCRAGLIYLSGITLSLYDPAGLERLFALLARARAGGVRVAFDTNFRPAGWPDRTAARAIFDRAFRISDVVFAGAEDFGLLHGIDQAEPILDVLARAGVAEQVVKLPNLACHVVAGPQRAVIEAEPVARVVDTTAAGDSFAAGYLAARRQGAGPQQAARAGHRLAGAVVGHPGAIIPAAAMPGASTP